MIIGITGSFASGKDTVADHLVEVHDFEHYSLSDVLREELRKKGQPVTRKNLQKLGNSLREQFGSGILAEMVLNRMNLFDNYVVTSIRHPEEVKALQKRRNFILVNVVASTQTRFKRMQSRKERNENDPQTLKEFKRLEKQENSSGSGQQIKKCQSMAKITLKNDVSLEELKKKIDKIVSDIHVKFLTDNRPKKVDYYLDIAKQVAQRSTCLSTKIGAIIVKDDQIIATGYNGAPRKTMDCLERGECLRRKLKIPSGQRYELCRSVHAEQNVIINAARSGASVLGADMYFYGTKVFKGQNKLLNAAPCFICKKIIINAGIKRFIGYDEDGQVQVYHIKDWVKNWSKKDMLDDMVKYDSKYFKENKDKLKK